MPTEYHISFRVAALPFSLCSWELTIVVTEHLLPVRLTGDPKMIKTWLLWGDRHLIGHCDKC